MQRFGRYLQEVLSTGWGIRSLTIGIASSVAAIVLIYRPNYALPYWVPGVLSILAFLIAPYRLYQRQLARIEELEAERQSRRRSVLVLIEEPGSIYLRRGTAPVPNSARQENGIYLELRVSLENKGERTATITRYDLDIEGIGTFPDAKPSPQNYVLGKKSQYAFGLAGKVSKYIEVLAERVTALQQIPFMLDAIVPPDLRQIQCTLNVTDTEGNSAKVHMAVPERL